MSQLDPVLSPPKAEDLDEFEQRLTHLQTQWADLKTLNQLEQMPPEQWQAAHEQLLSLESRMKEYLAELTSTPMVFWQAVRFGGLGLVMGVLLEKWLGQ